MTADFVCSPNAPSGERLKPASTSLFCKAVTASPLSPERRTGCVLDAAVPAAAVPAAAEPPFIQIALALARYFVRSASPLVPPLIFFVTATTSSLSATALRLRRRQYEMPARSAQGN